MEHDASHGDYRQEARRNGHFEFRLKSEKKEHLRTVSIPPPPVWFHRLAEILADLRVMQSARLDCLTVQA